MDTATASGDGSPPAAVSQASVTERSKTTTASTPGSDVGDPGSHAEVDPGGVVVGHVRPSEIVARSEPDEGSDIVAELANPTEIGGPLVFQLVEPPSTAADGPSEDWVEVYLPVRPNGTTGWVRRNELALSRNPFRIEVSTEEYRLEVFRDDELWLSTEVAIGTGETPTPLGRFYIIELLRPPDPNGIYGSFAFGLSGFSETLDSFAGGEGVIGIHGTNNPAALGSDVSHGCVRVSNETIETLAGVIPLGTPVLINA